MDATTEAVGALSVKGDYNMPEGMTAFRQTEWKDLDKKNRLDVKFFKHTEPRLSTTEQSYIYPKPPIWEVHGTGFRIIVKPWLHSSTVANERKRYLTTPARNNSNG